MEFVGAYELTLSNSESVNSFKNNLNNYLLSQGRLRKPFVVPSDQNINLTTWMTKRL